MPLFLQKRNTGLTEWMDRPDCDPILLENTYRQFGRINRLLSGWKKIYANHLKPVIQKNGGKASILDIGCGGGDVIRSLNQLCERDGFDVTFTGIDPDERASQYQKKLAPNNRITFRTVLSDEIVRQNERFDIVLSNHLLHHLTPSDLKELCNHSEQIARKKVLFSDIERSDIGYAAFATFAPLLFRNSYIVKDGQISIRRSYRKPELEEVLPTGWIVKRSFPFRLIATFQPRNHE